MTRIVMITTMRNEGAFVLDWIAHHRGIGVTDFLVYTNDCADGTDALLEALGGWGVVHVPNPPEGRKPIQWQMLDRARTHPLVAAADWLMVADVDEYLNIHAGDGRIADLLAACPEATGFALPWRMFGNDGQVEIRDTPVTERFTRAAGAVTLWPYRARCYKSLYHNDGSFAKLGVHRPRQPDRARYRPEGWVDGSGVPLKRDVTSGLLPAIMDTRDQYGLAQVNHYAVGTAQDFLLKRMRGKPNNVTDEIGLDYWVSNALGHVKDHSIQRHAARTAALRTEMLADVTVAGLHGAALAWRIAEAARLLEDEATARLYAAILLAGDSRPLPPALQSELWNRHVVQATARRAAK